MKINIIAIFIISVLCAAGQVIHGSVVLKAYNEYGQSGTTFHAGVPWTIEVALNDITDINTHPVIKGLDSTYLRNSSVMTTIINGKTTIKYSYKVRFDTVGSYAVGPAIIEKNGMQYQSNELTIKIIDQPSQSTNHQENYSASVLFAKMSVDKDHVVVGEKFTCVLRCYYTDQVTQAAPSSTMQIPGFVFEDGAQQANGIETIRGINYNYFEIRWQAHATQPGKKTIPAYAIDYIIESPHYGGHVSAIAMMLGHSLGERKRAYSNAISVTVDPLPAHAGAVHGIGTFSSFTATIDPTMAKQGEGIVLTLAIDGKGTLSKDHSLELQNIDPVFKYYDSKQYAQGTKKFFEFIVQGLEQGQWDIPRQSFTFFDTKERAYKTLYTNPITVKIIPGQITNTYVEHDTKALGGGDDEVLELDDIKPLLMYENDKAIPSIPWYIFIACVIALIGWGLYEFMYRHFNLLSFITQRTVKNNAFVLARKELKSIFSRSNVSFAYGVFIKLFATRCAVDQALVNQDFMYAALKQAGLSAQELEQWNIFYHELSELMFFNKNISPSREKSFQQYAYQWIDRLEKLL